MDISCTVKLQVAEIIKEDLWPNPLKYFSNVRFLIMCVLSSLKTSKISPFILNVDLLEINLSMQSKFSNFVVAGG